jgi:rhodanese-related sulfurtransferase
MKITTIITSTALVACMSLGALSSATAADIAVKITPTMASANVKHDGKAVTLMRNQDQENVVNPAFAKTSRKCPPFCVRPFTTAKGVETLGELEVINFAQKMSGGDSSIMLVDNRTPDWFVKGTIPGAVNVPFTKINRGKGADEVSIAESLELFGAVEGAKGWDFSKAKTLVLFCNGMWCGQSPLGIDGLIGEGYPAEKLKWYRGGMQSWEILGLTTVKP